VALARATVATMDPDRLRYFDADADAYFDDPGRPFSGPGADTPLGSGLEVFVTGLTPLALYVAQKVIDHVTEEAVDHADTRIRRLIRWRRPRKHTPVGERADGDAALSDLAALSPEQAEKIRWLVVNAARVRGVPAAAADELAEAVLAQLPQQTGTAGE